MQEPANLLEEIKEKTLPPKQTTDNESQTDDRQHEKLVQVNNELKNELQTFKEKVERVVTEKPDLFDGISEETSERLDHLISKIENQATQINVLHTERNQVEEQLQNEIKQLQRSVTRYCSTNSISHSISKFYSSLETSQNELDNERQMKMEQLSSMVKDHQTQIEQLQRNLSEKDNERSSLSERLNEVEFELRKTVNDHASTMAESQSLVEERDALVEQQKLHSAEK
jgi:chromosome segregation ATPase